MNVRDAMTANPRTLSPNDSIQSAARIMKEENAGSVPIVENGKLVGMVTDRDIVIRAVVEGSPANRPVRDIASGNVISTTPGASIRDAEGLMSKHQVRRLPVVENERLVGIISLGDIAVKEGKDSRTGDTLENISEGVKKH
jgi:CBS domain-containing protein